MNRRVIDSLLQGWAPDADTAWDWMRKMYDAGWELSESGQGEPQWLRSGGAGAVLISFRMERGVAKWVCSFGPNKPASAGLDNPVACATWYDLEGLADATQKAALNAPQQPIYQGTAPPMLGLATPQSWIQSPAGAAGLARLPPLDPELQHAIARHMIDAAEQSMKKGKS